MNSNVRVLPDTTVFLSFRLKIGLVVPSSNSGCISWLVSIILKSVSVQTRNSTYVRKYMKHNLVYMHTISLYAWVHSFQHFINLSLQVNIIFPPLMNCLMNYEQSLPSELASETLSAFSALLTAEDLTLGVLVASFLCSGIFWGFSILTPEAQEKKKTNHNSKYHQKVLIIII